MSKASTLASAIAAQLATITVAAGYGTDIGLTVFRGKVSLDADMLPCVVLVELDDHVLDQVSTVNMPGPQKRSKTVKLRQTYAAEGHTVCDPNNPNDAAHLILSDLKKCIFGGDQTFGGSVRTLSYAGRSIAPRVDGIAVISASIRFDVEFSEDLTNP